MMRTVETEFRLAAEWSVPLERTLLAGYLNG